MYKILFPNEPFDRKTVDSSYEGEYNVCKMFGIDTYFFDFDEFVNEGKFITNINKEGIGMIIYRGWMMKPEQYGILYKKILDHTKCGMILMNNVQEYQNCHCFPNAYDNIKYYTPRIIRLDKYDNHFDYKHLLKGIDFDFFIKDHVKSIKSENGVERIDKNITCIDLQSKIDSFIQERGNLFTGGIVLKEFVDLKKIDGKTNEWRVFYISGRILCSIQNSNLSTHDGPPTKLVDKIGDMLKDKSNFFTVDFAQLENGEWLIIETGDGQVSGLPNQTTTLTFYNNMLHFYSNQ